MNSGYIGRSKSVRAKEAEDRGELPLSKWTKAAILDGLPEEIRKEAEKLTLAELRAQALEHRGWHHFGKFFQAVDVFAVRDDLRPGELRHEKTERRKREERTHYYLISFTVWEGKYRKWRKPVRKWRIAKKEGGKNKYIIIEQDGGGHLWQECRLKVDSAEDLGTRRPARNARIWQKVRDEARR